MSEIAASGGSANPADLADRLVGVAGDFLFGLGVGDGTLPRQETVQGTLADLSAHLGKLKQGRNILAIQGLNRTANNEDFLAQAELTASSSQALPALQFKEIPDQESCAQALQGGPVAADQEGRQIQQARQPAAAAQPRSDGSQGVERQLQAEE